ncbi:MAG TPA: hypothetical protein VK453_04890 [Micromonosporaceae bacterium]|nr:hypothetical protein [Micromonosporaceae bacterium]
MTVRQFTVQLDRLPDDGHLRGLFIRCGDVGVLSSPRDDAATVLVDRHAPSFVDAIVSVIRDLDTVGVTPVSVRPDDDLVTIALIGERLGLSRQVVGPWSTGADGPGDFPDPVAPDLYRWAEVRRWLRDRMGFRTSAMTDRSEFWEEPDPGEDLGPTFTAVNLALRLRALAPRVDRIAAIRALLSG